MLRVVDELPRMTGPLCDEERAESVSHPVRVVLHGDVPGSRHPHQRRPRDLAGEPLGVVNLLEPVALSPDQQLRVGVGVQGVDELEGVAAIGGAGEGARDPQAIVEMVAADLGVSVMPTLNLPGRPPGIVTRPLEPHLPRRLALALGPDAGPAARAFVEELAVP